MKSVLAILTIILNLCVFDLFSQKSVYYYQDTGFDTLTIYDNKTFKSIGSVGLAKTIEYSGDCRISGDTLFLIHKNPIIINQLDTLYHELNSQDTLLRLDELTLLLINHNNYGFYKLIEKYDNNILSKKYSWKYTDRVVENIKVKGKLYKSLLINNFPIQHGHEIHYDKDGVIQKKSIWENGKLIEE